MGIIMARRTFPFETKIGFGDGHSLAPDNLRILNPVRGMAFPAFRSSVLSCELKPRRAMIKRLFIPPDQGEIPAMMLLVTLNAGLRFQIRVIPPSGTDPPVELDVAVQATLALNRLPEHVTGRAVSHPFKGGMRRGELPRRDLCAEE
jgi:hypothetical protein